MSAHPGSTTVLSAAATQDQWWTASKDLSPKMTLFDSRCLAAAHQPARQHILFCLLVFIHSQHKKTDNQATIADHGIAPCRGTLHECLAKKIIGGLDSLSPGRLETTGTFSCKTIQQHMKSKNLSLNQEINMYRHGSKTTTLEIDVYVWHYALIVVHARKKITFITFKATTLIFHMPLDLNTTTDKYYILYKFRLRHR